MGRNSSTFATQSSSPTGSSCTRELEVFHPMNFGLTRCGFIRCVRGYCAHKIFLYFLVYFAILVRICFGFLLNHFAESFGTQRELLCGVTFVDQFFVALIFRHQIIPKGIPHVFEEIKVVSLIKILSYLFVQFRELFVKLL